MNKNTTKITLPFSVALLMLPQIIETMYSPALTSIEAHFSVSASTAAEALPVFFIAFAFGVIFWGRMSDLIGRRPAMLGGLLACTIGTTAILFVTHFFLLLVAFALCAFGAAVGSVCTQTMMRDSYQGKKLAQVFTIVTASIGISPVVGLLSGSWLTAQGGYHWVFAVMTLLIFSLGIWSLVKLPETKPEKTPQIGLGRLALKLCCDIHIGYSVAMISLFNVALFAYYNIAPFMFQQLGFNVSYFGKTGFIIALGSIVGSLTNHRLLKKGLSDTTIVFFACLLMLISAVILYRSQSGHWFYLPMVVIAFAFNLAMPNLMGKALVNYQDQLGSAGALLGAFYYLLIGTGLGYASYVGDLGATLILCGSIATLLVLISIIASYSRNMGKRMVDID